MNFVLWKFIRNTSFLIIYTLFISLFDSIISNAGLFVFLFVVPFFTYWFSFKTLRNVTLVFMFFPFSLFVLIVRGNTELRCNRCHRTLYSTGHFLHEVSESKGFILSFFDSKFYNVKTASQIRCYSPDCYPKNELFQTRFQHDYVFLRKVKMLKKIYQDKHSIINLDQLDLNLSSSGNETL